MLFEVSKSMLPDMPLLEDCHLDMKAQVKHHRIKFVFTNYLVQSCSLDLLY